MVNQGYRILYPFGTPLLAGFCNRFLAKLPIVQKMCLVNFLVARPPAQTLDPKPPGVRCSVIVPTRNEAGNIVAAVERTPLLGAHTEMIFVDGDSTDGTVEAIEEQIERYAGSKDIKLIHQVPRGSQEAATGKMLSLGKGDARSPLRSR